MTTDARGATTQLLGSIAEDDDDDEGGVLGGGGPAAAAPAVSPAGSRRSQSGERQASGGLGRLRGALTPRSLAAAAAGGGGASNSPYVGASATAPQQSLLLTDLHLEDPLQGTTQEACLGKLSAVTAGYYEDPYLACLVQRCARKAPLINRGCYTRVAAIRKTIAVFLKSMAGEAPGGVQIVNLGAGLDTTYFWVEDFFPSTKSVVFEVDFWEVLAGKVECLMQSATVWGRLSSLPGATSADTARKVIRSEKPCPIRMNDKWVLVPGDLRSSMDALGTALAAAGFSAEKPTLYVAECALVYLRTPQSDSVVHWAASASAGPSAFVIYEQINPFDAFGRVMLKNLEARGCPLLGIHDYPTLESQRDRFEGAGWETAVGADMNEVQDCFIDRYELLRIQRLELLDEVEEYRLIQSHYFVVVATRGPRTPAELADLRGHGGVCVAPLSARERRLSENSSNGSFRRCQAGGAAGGAAAAAAGGGVAAAGAGAGAGGAAAHAGSAGAAGGGGSGARKPPPGGLGDGGGAAFRATEDAGAAAGGAAGNINGSPVAPAKQCALPPLSPVSPAPPAAAAPYPALAAVASLFDASRIVREELPRFTTEQILRRASARSSSPEIAPGPLSDLMIPSQHVRDLKWQVRSTPPGRPEDDLPTR